MTTDITGGATFLEVIETSFRDDADLIRLEDDFGRA